MAKIAVYVELFKRSRSAGIYFDKFVENEGTYLRDMAKDAGKDGFDIFYTEIETDETTADALHLMTDDTTPGYRPENFKFLCTLHDIILALLQNETNRTLAIGKGLQYIGATIASLKN